MHFSLLDVATFVAPVVVILLLTYFKVTDKKVILAGFICFVIAVFAFSFSGYDPIGQPIVEAGGRNNAESGAIALQFVIFLLFLLDQRSKKS